MRGFSDATDTTDAADATDANARCTIYRCDVLLEQHYECVMPLVKNSRSVFVYEAPGLLG